MECLSGKVDGVWDHTCLIALDASIRDYPIKRGRYLDISPSDVYYQHSDFGVTTMQEIVQFLSAHLGRTTDGGG